MSACRIWSGSLDGGVPNGLIQMIREQGVKLMPRRRPFANKAPCCLMMVKKCGMKSGFGTTMASQTVRRIWCRRYKKRHRRARQESARVRSFCGQARGIGEARAIHIERDLIFPAQGADFGQLFFGIQRSVFGRERDRPCLA